MDFDRPCNCLGSRTAIEFQTDEHLSAVVAAKYWDAGIPMIAIDIPHPGATFYGANNYEAGMIGGDYLGRWVKEYWHSELDESVLLGLPHAGNIPRMRLTGMLALAKLVPLNIVLPNAGKCRITYLDGDGISVAASKPCGGICAQQMHAVWLSAPSTIRAPWAPCVRFRKPIAPRTAQ